MAEKDKQYEIIIKPDFISIEDYEVLDISIPLSELEDKKRLAAHGALVRAEYWFPGYGDSYLRALPFWNPNRVYTKNGVLVKGGYDVGVSWHSHNGFLDDPFLCVGETLGWKGCPSCKLRFRLAKELFNRDYKHPFLKEHGLYTKTRNVVNILLIKDCGDKGKEFPRQEYQVGKDMVAMLPITGYQKLLAVMSDKDANEIAPVWHPTKGCVLRYTVTDNPSNNQRQHDVVARPPTKWVGPLWPLPHDENGYKGMVPDVARINEIMANARDLSVFLTPPSDEQMEAANRRADELWSEAMKLVSTKHVVLKPGDGDEESSEESTKFDSKDDGEITIDGPTEIVDKSGTRLCFGKGLIDSEDVTCQSCTKYTECV